MSDKYIETSTGRKFYLEPPFFIPEEIAHSLGNLCRYTGHCTRFYSVAEHSVLVASIMSTFNLGDPFEGLMHDASESVLADIASPWKELLPDYRELERKLDCAMRAQFKLPAAKTDGCTLADLVALLAEADQMMPSRAKDWDLPQEARRLFAKFSPPRLGKISQTRAAELWLESYYVMAGQKRHD